MASQAELRQQITEQIIKALEAGTPPWRKPWSDFVNTGFPANVVSKRSYTGVNPLLLDLTANARGFQSRWWATYNQWQSLGLRVKARPAGVPSGHWGTKIVFYKPVTKKVVSETGEPDEEKFFVLRTYTVFNAEQAEGDGIEKYLAQPRNTTSPFMDYDPAEEVIAATEADIRYGGDKALYCSTNDCIRLPERESFASTGDFYATAFHELAHWTGHESRLDRLSKNARFGSAAYAFEELVAEICGCFAATEVGVPQSEDLTNHHAYLSNWLTILQQDHGAILRASSQASKAVDFILAFSRKIEADAENEEPVADVTG